MKSKLEVTGGVSINNMSIEEWQNEFNKIDHNKSGFITFKELCLYVVKYIETPEQYMRSASHLEDDSDISDGEVSVPHKTVTDNAPIVLSLLNAKEEEEGEEQLADRTTPLLKESPASPSSTSKS